MRGHNYKRQRSNGVLSRVGEVGRTLMFCWALDDTSAGVSGDDKGDEAGGQTPMGCARVGQARLLVDVYLSLPKICALERCFIHGIHLVAISRCAAFAFIRSE